MPIALYIIGGVIIAIVVLKSVLNSMKKKKQTNYFQTVIDKIKVDGYTISKYFVNLNRDLLIGFDEDKKELFVTKVNEEPKFYSFDKILDCTLNINGQNITKSSASNIVGGAILAGGVGALIGSTMKQKTSTKLTYVGLTLTIDNLSSPNLNLCFAKGDEYQCVNSKPALEEWHHVFKVIVERNLKSK